MRIGAHECNAGLGLSTFYVSREQVGIIIYSPGGKTMGQTGNLGGLIQPSYSRKLI